MKYEERESAQRPLIQLENLVKYTIREHLRFWD